MPTSPRRDLFDAAINRALTYALRLGVPLDDPAALRQGLEVWYLKTRFAYRVPLNDVLNTLSRCPDTSFTWSGGLDGQWQAATKLTR